MLWAINRADNILPFYEQFHADVYARQRPMRYAHTHTLSFHILNIFHTCSRMSSYRAGNQYFMQTERENISNSFIKSRCRLICVHAPNTECVIDCTNTRSPAPLPAPSPAHTQKKTTFPPGGNNTGYCVLM